MKKSKARKENRCVEGWCFSLERANAVSGPNFKIEMVSTVGGRRLQQVVSFSRPPFPHLSSEGVRPCDLCHKPPLRELWSMVVL